MKWWWICVFLFSLTVKAQTIITIAGGGSSLGDGGPATSAAVPNPGLGAFDKSGRYYFPQSFSSPRIRMIDVVGTIHTVAGTGTAGFSGDGGLATTAKIQPQGLAVDAQGNIYIGDYYNNRIRRVDATTGIINTIAGIGTAAFSGDGGPASVAELMPSGICLDKSGNIYFVDGGGYRVRKINTAGIITTVAGNGTAGTAGDGGPATAAQLAMNGSLCIDSSGNLYLACNYKIRKVSKSTGIITTYAGTGTFGYIGDGMPATAAQFDSYIIGMDTMRNELYIADRGNDRVHKIDAVGIFHSIAGTTTSGFSGDGGPATAAKLYNPEGITTDTCGNVYIADGGNNRIRKIIIDTPCYVVNTTLDIQAINYRHAMSIYPNPVYDELQVENANPNSEYKLYNLAGTILQHGVLQYSSNTIQLNTLPPGMYLLQIADSKGERTVHRIIKQ